MNDWQKLKRHKLETPPSLFETTSHLQLPEVIGEKVDKRTLRKTGRTEQFATRVSKEWLEKVKGIAEKEKLKLVEVLERMLEVYEKQTQLISLKKDKEIKEIFSNKLVNDGGEEINSFCSFFPGDEQKDRITCAKPLFDRKKVLCRSHNRQVRKRFNEFTKGMSVSSTAAWEMSWEQSNDWKYFWSLAEEKNKTNSPSEAKYFDQPHIRVAIKQNSKEPVLQNWVDYLENRTISELVKVGNYGLRTGKKLGDYYFCALDIDKHGEQYHFPQISYVESYKGRHYYLLFRKLPENIPLFYQGEKIGRLMSQGKQVIGSGSLHPMGITYKFIERGETFLKFEDEQQLANYLHGYGIVLKK